MRVFVVALSLGLVALPVGCALFTDLSGFSKEANDQSPDGSSATDSAVDDGALPDSGTKVDTEAGVDAGDSGSDASSCSCTNLVSAYRFSNANALGQDAVGGNNMSTVLGSPKQSSIVPPGRTGSSIELDGSSAVCIASGFTFDSTQDHTLCWWAQPTTLGDLTNQFAQTCGYDTWTSGTGAHYVWRINNCNGGTAADFTFQNVYTVGSWVQICQTYERAVLKRTVIINGKTDQKVSQTDTVPIVEDPGGAWCIGAYKAGGFWTGRIYLPLWFNRVLTDAEIQQVNATACCLP